MGTEQTPDHRSRWLALIAIVIAFAVVGFLLLGGDEDYRVTAHFAAANGVATGGVVKVAGRNVGTVESISLTDEGQAALELKITDDAVLPLRRGTIAALRSPGLSSAAGKFVDLRIPSGQGPEIDDGGVLTRTETSSSVDVDQVFNTFDEKTRKGLRKVVRGSATMTRGQEVAANEGWKYLNPSLVASERLFREIGGDREVLERFLVDSSKLVTDVAARRADVTKLVDGLAETTQAIASRDDELSDAISQVPPFMRRANTTFVNLRATVRDLDALLADAKPVTPKLRAALAELRPFAVEARPTFRDLAALTQRAGKGNDLVELYRAFPKLRDIAITSKERNGKVRPGSFATSAEAFKSSREPLGFLRAYGVELTGWFDDFGHSGLYDAFGNASRVSTNISPTKAVLDLLPLPTSLKESLSASSVTVQRNRCPGAMERPAADGSNPWKPSPDFACDLTEKPVGR